MYFVRRLGIYVLLLTIVTGFQSYQVSLADEISDLKRKLEYLEAKELLETELQLLEAQVKSKKLEIQKLASDYEDVRNPDTEGAQDAPVAEAEPAAGQSVAEAAVVVESESREWEATKLRAPCGWRMKGTAKVGADGTFAFDGWQPQHNWSCHYDGNLLDSTATTSSCGNSAKVHEFNSVKAGENWNVKFLMKWPGGQCRISFILQ